MAHWRKPTKREAGETPPLSARPVKPVRVRMCEECGKNPADPPGRVCVGCDAYREHTGHF